MVVAGGGWALNALFWALLAAAAPSAVPPGSASTRSSTGGTRLTTSSSGSSSGSSTRSWHHLAASSSSSTAEEDARREEAAAPAAAAVRGGGHNCRCRSNATHVVWHQHQQHHNGTTGKGGSSAAAADSSSSGGGCGCVWQTLPEARTESYRVLRDNLMAFDRPFRETMGFRDGSDDDDVDGLADGLVEPAVRWALQAKVDFAYADRLPRALFREYVLNYASLNEGRTSVRQLLRERLVEPLFLQQQSNNNSNNNSNSTLGGGTTSSNENRTIAETVAIVNTRMWTVLAPRNSGTIRFVAGQTPAVLDAASVLAFGYASCTGLAVLMVEALRAAGVPARVAGTPAWNGHRQNGNHNWVEVWTGGGGGGGGGGDGETAAEAEDTTVYDWHQSGWAFLEPSPAQSVVDTVDRDPCERWFCTADRFRETRVYAARLLQQPSHSSTPHFPLAWERDCTDVPAVDRTAHYRRVCSPCGGGTDTDSSSDVAAVN